MEGMTSKQVGHLFENISSVFRQCIFSVLSVGPVPGHIAFIMDGNRRYSKKQNLVDGHGHRAGFSALIKMLKYCYEFGVKHITVYAFSIDNFKRRPEEVEYLMKLMQEKIDELIKEESIINRLGIRIYFQGNLKLLSEPVRSAAERAMVKTAAYSRAVLSVCVAYTSTDEIVHAVQESCEEKWDEIRKRDANGGNLIGLKENGKDKDEHLIGVTNVDRHMYMAVVPDPDIIIRTSGETRLSRMRPIFCGNFEFETRQSELERLFKRYGRVDRVDMKSGFAFVYMDNERDAEDAIQGLDRIEFGRKGRRLRVEWSKEERSRKPEGSRKSSSSSRVSKSLFVINFDPYNTRTRDLERHFDPHGKILNIRIRRNFAFIQFETQEDATRALDATNMSKLMDRVITVEYAIKDDDDRKNGYGPGKTYDRSPRRGYDRDRSRSPYGRGRSSPDYGRGRDRPSPDYGRGRDRPSPDYGRGRDRLSPDYGRGRDRLSPDYGRGRSPSPKRRERNSEYGRGRSPDVGKERMPDHDNVHSPSPRQRAGPGNGRVSSPLERRSPGYGDRPSPSPQRERREKYSPDGYTRGSNPSSKPEPVESPVRDGRESSERYQSRSPPLRERSRS